jgi:hypothetical protein
MQALGQSQARVLQPFLQAAEKAGRKDLARFLLRAAAGVLTEDIGPEQWIGRLTDAGPRLADRAETHRNVALAVTDRKGAKAKNRVIKKAYDALRTQAKRHTMEAMPRLAELIAKHVR